MGEPITSEEDWDTVKNVEPEKKELKIMTRGEMIDFETQSHKAYQSMVAREFWSYTERELKLTDCDRQPRSWQEMPKLTVESLWSMLENNFSYYPNYRFRFLKGRLDISERVEVEEFVKIVRRDRIMSINTEGCEDMTAEDMPLVMVAMSNLEGRVIFYANATEMSRDVQDLLMDVSIAKLGSGLYREGEELHRIGIKIRGWISSGALYRAFLRREAKTGIEAQCTYLSEFCGGKRFHYVKYYWKWGKLLRSSLVGKIPRKCWSHICMNVQVPLAVACATAIKFAKDRRLAEDTLAFPIMWEGFDLVRMKVPEDLVNISDEPQENWVANLPDGLHFSRHQRLNDCRELTFLRKAQADFVEVYEEFYEPGTGAALAYQLYLDPLGRRWPLPSFSMGKRGAVREYLMQRCSTCGSPYHKHERCNKETEIPPCSYEHDGVMGLTPHTIRTCPVLHTYCGLCFMRGHDPSAHQGLYSQN
jgi:hypothetical protein